MLEWILKLKNRQQVTLKSSMHFHFERMKRNLVVEWNADRKMSVNFACGDEKLLCPSTSLVKWHIGVVCTSTMAPTYHPCETLNPEFLHEKGGGGNSTSHASSAWKSLFFFFSLLYSSNDDVASLPFSTSCYLLSNDNNWGQFPSKERTNSITVSSPDSF